MPNPPGGAPFEKNSASVPWPGRHCSTPNLKRTLSCARVHKGRSNATAAAQRQNSAWPVPAATLRPICARRASSRPHLALFHRYQRRWQRRVLDPVQLMHQHVHAEHLPSDGYRRAFPPPPNTHIHTHHPVERKTLHLCRAHRARAHSLRLGPHRQQLAQLRVLRPAKAVGLLLQRRFKLAHRLPSAATRARMRRRRGHT